MKAYSYIFKKSMLSFLGALLIISAIDFSFNYISYLTFYSNFKKWYDELHQSLISKNKAYKGMAYRIASEKIFNYQSEYEQIWFRGFDERNVYRFSKI